MVAGLGNTLHCYIYRLSFGVVVGTMNKTANAMENGEYDFDGTAERKVYILVILYTLGKWGLLEISM